MKLMQSVGEIFHFAYSTFGKLAGVGCLSKSLYAGNACYVHRSSHNELRFPLCLLVLHFSS